MAASNHIFTSVVSLKARAISDLVKPELPIAAGICVVAGQIIGLGGLPVITDMLLGFLAGFFISGSAMITNDYFDLEVDKINHPGRPLPSGRITLFELIAMTCFFSIAGFAAAGLLGAIPLALTLFIWAVGIIYNWKGKEAGLPGNMMVSLSVAWTFIFGGISIGVISNGVVWTFGVLAFIFDLAEEIAGGAMDVEGDRQRSARTLASARGRDYALRVSGFLFLLFIALSFLPYAAGWLNSIYLALVTVTDILVFFFAFKLLKSRTPVEGRAQIRYIYLTMTLFIVVFIASRIF